MHQVAEARLNLLVRFLEKIFGVIPPKETDEDLRTIKEFTQNIYWAEDMTALEAKHAIEGGVVELFYRSGGHAANGLLISSNGFFVTAAHCLRDGLADRVSVRLADGRVFKRVEIYKMRSDIDIALARIDLDGPAEPLKYRFFNQREFMPKRRLPIVVLMRKDGQLSVKGCFTDGMRVVDTGKAYAIADVRQHILIEGSVHPGDSGGIAVDVQGRVIGVLSTGHTPEDTTWPYGTLVAWSDVLELLTVFSVR